jgi:hypothetical protein
VSGLTGYGRAYNQLLPYIISWTNLALFGLLCIGSVAGAFVCLFVYLFVCLFVSFYVSFFLSFLGQNSGIVLIANIHKLFSETLISKEIFEEGISRREI